MIRYVPVNIVMRFGKAVVKLPNHTARVQTREGVTLYVIPKQDGSWRAMAEIPEGTLDRYKHCSPEILECDWYRVEPMTINQL